MIKTFFLNLRPYLVYLKKRKPFNKQSYIRIQIFTKKKIFRGNGIHFGISFISMLQPLTKTQCKAQIKENNKIQLFLFRYLKWIFN